VGTTFCRYQLRTTDPGAARAFYTDLFGPELWADDITVVPLPERAAARGAPAHWLGHLGVDDAEATARRFLDSGAEQLGPLQRAPDGSSIAVLRDPFGAIVALSSEKLAPREARVVWRVLHTRDEAPAFAFYAALFGWAPLDVIDLGGEGRHQRFAWDASGRAAGSVSNSARLPHVHAQWLFCFGVTNIEASLEHVRARGGLTLGVTRTPGGALVAGCDDPQGAAFALYQQPAPG
jgi:uncharacterized protein